MVAKLAHCGEVEQAIQEALNRLMKQVGSVPRAVGGALSRFIAR